MQVHQIVGFLTGALGSSKRHWSAEGVQDIAFRTFPEMLMGPHQALLRADTNLLWARWFVESVCSPLTEGTPRLGYAFIYAEVAHVVSLAFQTLPRDERSVLASAIARFVLEDADARRRVRQPLSRDERWAILEKAGPLPRCWICGYPFSEQAVSRFLGLTSITTPVALPEFIDCMKPRGISQRDLGIEVDHVVPVAAGGENEENLALACGWCNGQKGARLTLYDTGADDVVLIHPKLGRISVPRPFWIVRLLAIRGRCEWPGGCTRTTKTSELTVAPRWEKGTMNPMNLQLTCAEHDPLGESRLVSRKAWTKAPGA